MRSVPARCIRFLTAFGLALATLAGLELTLRALQATPECDFLDQASTAHYDSSAQESEDFLPGVEAGTFRQTANFGRQLLVWTTRPRGIRVAVFGSSALYDGWRPYFGCFPYWLQRYLRAVAGREVPVEVINSGVPGANLTMHAERLERFLQINRPDLVIVYSGNNEFHPIRARKAWWPGYNPRAERIRIALSGLHLYRLLVNILRPVIPPPETVDRPRGISVDDIPAYPDEEDRLLATAIYRDGLNRVATATQRAGVPLLMTTVANNLLHVAPSGEGAATTAVRQLQEQLKRCPRAEAPALIAQTRALMVSRSDVAALGMMLHEAGWTREAYQVLLEAEAMARTPHQGNEAMRMAARQVSARRRVPLCDLARELASRSPGGLPGFDLFRDECHFRAEGHRRVGEILARTIVDRGLLRLPGTPERQRARLEAAIRTFSIEGDPWRLDQWTFDKEEVAQAEQRLATTPALRLAIQGHRCMQPDHPRPQAQHTPKNAARYYRQALRASGPPGPLYLDLGLALWMEGRTAEARQALDQAARFLPEDVEIWQYRANLP